MDRSILFLLIVLSAFLASTFCKVIFNDGNYYEGSPCKFPDGTEGICSENCTTKSINVSNRKVCGFRRDRVIMCCPNEENLYPTIAKVPDIVRVGDVSLDAEDKNEYGKEYMVVDVYGHLNYLPPAYYNDIAILRIEANAEHYSIVSPLPACIFTENDLPVDTLLIMGYGAPAFGRAHNYKLYEGNLTILSNDICGQSYEFFEELPNGIIDSQICAHDPSRIMDTCEGDSGGPLQLNANDEFNTPYLAGITSFGVLCLDGNPGVYTRIYSYLGWIESIINEDE